MDKQTQLMLDKYYKNLERCYRTLFKTEAKKPNEATKEVLADLRVFCYATQSSFSSDIAEMARREGRREVFNRIVNFLQIDYEEYRDFNPTLYEELDYE